MSRLTASAGFLLPYFGVCGLAGLLVRHQASWRLFADGWREPPACLPQRYMLGAIGAHCPFAPVNWFWAATLGFPHLVASLPGFALLAISRGAAWPAAVPMLVLSCAAFVALYAGAGRFWRARGRPRVATFSGCSC